MGLPKKGASQKKILCANLREMHKFCGFKSSSIVINFKAHKKHMSKNRARKLVLFTRKVKGSKSHTRYLNL